MNLFRKKTVGISAQEAGTILQPIMATIFPPEAFANPEHSALPSTPQFTYLTMLGTWFVSRYQKHSPDKIVDHFIDVYVGNEKEKKRLSKMKITGMRKVLVSIVDSCFRYSNPIDPAGDQWEKAEPDFVQSIDYLEEQFVEKVLQKNPHLTRAQVMVIMA